MEGIIAGILFIAILFIVFMFSYFYKIENKRELIFEKHKHYNVKDPTYIIVSTVDNKKYKATDQESMEKVAKLVIGKRIDKTKIENNILQIYYRHGESVDVEIQGLTEYYRFDNKK